MATKAMSNEDLKVSKLFNVEGLVAVVTGGGTGIGLMITQALVANEPRSTSPDAYNTGPGKIVALPGDITNKDEIKRLAGEVEKQESNGIHLLVNNAGIARDDNTKYPSNGSPDFKSAKSISEHLWKSEPQQWQETFETNLTAQYFMSVGFLPLLEKGRLAQKGYTSSIVNIASISGMMRGSSMGQFSYATSKGGFIHLTRILALTLSEAKIRVNCIAPGIYPSEMTGGDSNEWQKTNMDMSSGNPAGRKGQDSDMAACILYLVGPGGLFLNGQVIYPDGGVVLTSPANL